MSDEEDIGLYSLSHKPGLVIGTPPRQRGLRRQSIVSIIKDEEKTPIKSPSHPSLFNGSPKISTRKLSRSNTLPRLASQRSDASADITLEGLGIVTMERERAEKLRRWILALVVVDFDLDYGPKITGVYPPLDFTAAESENMYVSF
ncbi:hypothetical protein EIP86_007156 [Pleurotus ostreatoroseus]|nr:hypothetical protein EIP86_007156 [Pleurotus ostreatoroseus]